MPRIRERIAKVLKDEGDGAAVVCDTLAGVLATAAPNEASLFEAVAKSGGDESVREAAAVYVRAAAAIIDAYDGHLPDEVRKAMFGDRVEKARPAPVPKPMPVTKSDEPKETLEEVMKSLERATDMGAERRLNEAAARIRHANPSLSAPQAFVKAMEDSPEDYAGYQRHQLRKMHALDDTPFAMRKARERGERIEAAGRRVREAEPELTHAQAIAKALKADPELYT